MTTNTNAALPDAVRVPLDSLHADAEYLCARLLDKSLTREEVVTAIRFRIDAAKAALTTAAAVPAEGWVMVPVEPTEEMIIAGVDASLRVADAWLGGDDTKNPHVARWFAMLASAPKAEPLRSTTLPLAITSAPERIWLDLGFNPYEEDAHFSNLHDLTWSKDNATGDGIEYVRVDLTSAPKAEPVPTDHFPDAGEMVAGAHIQQPFTLAEIKAKIASNDYSAELMLQHAMLLLEKPDAVAGPREAVAYLDIGGGGYLDLGSDLSDEALRKLPKGRNMLAIVGTYGVDGYVPVATPTSAMWKAWQAARAQPTPPAVVEPLTDEQAKAVLWAEHLRWMEAAGLDTEGMQPTGEWLDHWLVYVRAIEAAHGIGIKKGAQDGTL